MSTAIRLLVIAGLERDDRAEPFVIGAFNEEYMAQLPAEDADEQIATLKQTWTGDPQAYEWREIYVSIPSKDVAAHFSGPEIDGTVEAGA